MSEPIREQLARTIERVNLYLDTRAELMPGQVHHDAIADIDMGSQGHIRLLASDVEALLAALSPVGETEAAKLPLDPKPMVSLGHWDRHGLGPDCEGYECGFNPRPEYSQNREDYR